ncbi:hypothetical protein CFT12S00416_07940 [Campylobacter fetus subsp. testudinum]|uniref:hypothetical protein n=1 Tax=Campylobacter fetus TaxID=196 RepID=UPI000818C418|nr:hypothetical protein [Campylobacter fetus]OCR87748.1 hypothetical protein CFT12S00416_07940 [Campylobacter fetus subsp. testudinum]OCR99074.1 hypothetical protein A9K75_08485 [Campylobacter fetus subsp. testudinum]
MKKIVLSFLMAYVSVLFGADINPLAPQNFRSLNQQETIQAQQNNAGLTDLKQQNFNLSINSDEIKEIKEKDKELKTAFDDLDETIVNYQPFKKPISTVDKLTTHPKFTTTILLPAGSKISSIDMSVEPITLKYEENTILLRVKKDFLIGNLTVIYKLENTNYIANFLIEKYDRAKTDEQLNLVLTYENIKKRDGFEVINIFLRTNNKYPTAKYNYIEIDGIMYRIILDDLNGQYIIGKNKYRVEI